MAVYTGVLHEMLKRLLDTTLAGTLLLSQPTYSGYRDEFVLEV